jgi:hypothetical protein
VDDQLQALHLWTAQSLTDATPTLAHAHLGASSDVRDALISEVAP